MQGIAAGSSVFLRGGLAGERTQGVKSGGGFMSALRRAEAMVGGGAGVGADGEVGGAARARLAAEEFVSISLVQPILAQMRSQNSAAAPFGPGEAERAFGPLWDAEIAARITRAGKFGVVDAVARKLLERMKPMPGQETDADGA